MGRGDRTRKENFLGSWGPIPATRPSCWRASGWQAAAFRAPLHAIPLFLLSELACLRALLDPTPAWPNPSCRSLRGTCALTRWAPQATSWTREGKRLLLFEAVPGSQWPLPPPPVPLQMSATTLPAALLPPRQSAPSRCPVQRRCSGLPNACADGVGPQRG